MAKRSMLETMIRNMIFNYSQNPDGPPIPREEVIRLLRKSVGLKDGERP